MNGLHQEEGQKVPCAASVAQQGDKAGSLMRIVPPCNVYRLHQEEGQKVPCATSVAQQGDKAGDLMRIVPPGIVYEWSPPGRGAKGAVCRLSCTAGR